MSKLLPVTPTEKRFSFITTDCRRRRAAGILALDHRGEVHADLTGVDPEAAARARELQGSPGGRSAAALV